MGLYRVLESGGIFYKQVLVATLAAHEEGQIILLITCESSSYFKLLKSISNIGCVWSACEGLGLIF